MRTEVLGIDPATYRPHQLHTTDREWTETNCYVDLWVEVIHALGLDPVPAAACTLSSDFEGDQWTMFKFPGDDLRRLYGLEVAELNVWRPVLDHLVEQLSFGRLLTVDVDAWWLPDTEGVSYRCAHQKTTLAAEMVDPDHKRLGYFHNAGYFELEGEDFDGLLRLGAHRDPPSVLPPYVESVRLDRIRRDPHALVDTARALVAEHLARRPATNPMPRMQARLEADLAWLADQDMEAFHRYAFGTCRQCGANAELAATLTRWLDGHDGGLEEVAGHFDTVSRGAKALQFGLARAARGRRFDVTGAITAMGEAWEAAMDELAARYG